MLPNEIPESGLILLWCGAALVAGLAVLPGLIQFLGLAVYFSRWDENPNYCEPGDDDPLYEDIYLQLLALGFKPLGTMHNQGWFFNGHWTKTFSHRVFGSRRLQCFATVYRLLPGEPVRVALVSCFPDGAMVWTGNHLENFRKYYEGYVRWGINTGNLARLLAGHQEMVQQFTEVGRVPADHDNLVVLSATSAAHSRLHLRETRFTPNQYLTDALLWVGVGPPLTRHLLDLPVWTVPALIILGGVGRLVFWQAARGALARGRRQEVGSSPKR